MAIKLAKNKLLVQTSLVAVGALVLVATNFWLYKSFGFGIFCLWHNITGLYCPGCGATRMLFSLVTGNFYQAFRFNPLLFILLPFGLWLFCDYLLYGAKKIKKPLTDRLPGWVWIILIIITLAFGILRNFERFSILAPIEL